MYVSLDYKENECDSTIDTMVRLSSLLFNTRKVNVIGRTKNTSTWNFSLTLKNCKKKMKVSLAPVGEIELSKDIFLKFSLRPFQLLRSN